MTIEDLEKAHPAETSLTPPAKECVPREHDRVAERAHRRVVAWQAAACQGTGKAT
jgi:hypothetical protein